MTTILFYYETEEPYGCFSNFSAHAVYLKGIIWPTTEHYFQAQKFAGTPLEERVRLAKTPEEAKRLGKINPARPDWKQIRDEIMLEAVRAKFTQHPNLREILLSTGDDLMAENAPRDDYWGIGENGRGTNRLGQILMQVRSELRGQVK